MSLVEQASQMGAIDNLIMNGTYSSNTFILTASIHLYLHTQTHTHMNTSLRNFTYEEQLKRIYINSTRRKEKKQYEYFYMAPVALVGCLEGPGCWSQPTSCMSEFYLL